MLDLSFLKEGEKIININTFNMLSIRSGEAVKNQYIIEILCSDTKHNDVDYKIFKSYNSFICCVRNGHIVLLGKNYNYSRTTSKYLSVFLKEYTCFENMKEVLKEYELLENGQLKIKKGGENNE